VSSGEGKGVHMESRRSETLVMALSNERRERAFYLAQAERTRNRLGRSMFLRIADDELEHAVRLERIHEELARGGAWPEGVELGLKLGEVGRSLDALVGELGQAAGEADADDLEAVETACRFEAEGERLYAQLAGAASEKREKAFFELLSSMEREHFRALKEVEEYLRDPASYFTVKERHGLDGA